MATCSVCRLYFVVVDLVCVQGLMRRGENWTWKELMMRNLRRSVYSPAHTAASAVYEIDDVQRSMIYAQFFDLPWRRLVVESSHCQHLVGQSDIHQTVPVSLTLICIQGHSEI